MVIKIIKNKEERIKYLEMNTGTVCRKCIADDFGVKPNAVTNFISRNEIKYEYPTNRKCVICDKHTHTHTKKNNSKAGPKISSDYVILKKSTVESMINLLDRKFTSPAVQKRNDLVLNLLREALV